MRRLALIAPLALTALAHAQSGFWLTHDPYGEWSGSVQGFSQDGSIAIGFSWGTFPDDPWAPGFTWTVATGRYDFGLERGMPYGTLTRDVSSDGNVIVGQIYKKVLKNPPEFYLLYYAYRRVGNGPVENLGLLKDWPRSVASGVSGDGQIVVGTGETSSQYQTIYGEPFRWTAQTGMVGLGHLKPEGSYTTGEGISRDGTTIVGTSRSREWGPYEAYRWTAQTGMVQLPSLPGIPDDYYGAEAVNADGSVIVGWVHGEAPNENYPVRWVNGEIEALGILGPKGGGRMRAVDDSGNVIGGQFDSTATIWTPATGLMFFEDYLAGFGINLPEGVVLADVFSISGDGRTFGGWTLINNNWCGFVATIPAPCAADCDQSGTLDIDDFICFQTLFALGDAAADCDQSGDLDIDDFICFQTAFGLGCP